MTLVPADYPERLAARGVPVQVFGDWITNGSSADHRAVVLHHTASSANANPADDAAYSHHGGDDAPHYNVMVDRTGVAWILAREKANSSGKISHVARDEVLAGQANLTPAGQRGLGDDTSANENLFAIAAENDGTGEHWSDALVRGMSIASAVALECLGLGHAGYVTTHRALTSRKIDPCGANCPNDWHALINAQLGGIGPVPEVDEMYAISAVVPAGTEHEHGVVRIGLPDGRKSASVVVFVDTATEDGVNLWAAQIYDGGAQGLWADGRDWDVWLPGSYAIAANVHPNTRALRLEHCGGARVPVTVAISGT